VADDPASLGGGETDKHVVYEGLSRVAADAILVGAETMRGSSAIFSVWHPELVNLRRSLGLPRHPMQIVATLTGIDLDRELTFNVPEVPVSIVTITSAAAAMERAIKDRPWIHLIVMAQPTHLVLAFSQLRSLNVRCISCVGGRSLAAQLLDLDLVDDIYLTTSAREGGKANTPIYSRPLGGTVVVRKQGTAEEAGVVFEHLHLSTKAQ
jgi:riboflavin biosynthesis pyrimidine reductase